MSGQPFPQQPMPRRFRERYPRAWSFLGRRLSPGQYLGLHLTVGLLLILVTLAGFGFIAGDVAGKGALTRFDEEVAALVSEHARTHPEMVKVFFVITEIGGKTAMLGLAIVLGAVLFVRGERFLGFVVLITILGGSALDGVLKEIFQRERPPTHPTSLHSWSFPSGHSMGSLVGYGMLAYVLVLHLRRPWAKIATVLGLAALVLAVGFSRLYLGAHYFSDVVGGFTAGALWLAVCISGMEVVRRRRVHRAQGRAASGGGPSLPNPPPFDSFTPKTL
jgi:membrane-associated phospholipid phosphatase